VPRGIHLSQRINHSSKNSVPWISYVREGTGVPFFLLLVVLIQEIIVYDID
jgi:hypothetical protein